MLTNTTSAQTIPTITVTTVMPFDLRPIPTVAFLLTVLQQIGDVQLQRREDLVEHLEVLSKTRHLNDKAGRCLGRKVLG